MSPILYPSRLNERDRRVCDRIKAVLAYDEGYAYTDIARMWLLDDESIRRHVKDDWEHDRLAPQSGGTSSKLNEEQTEALVHHLSELECPLCMFVSALIQYDQLG